MRVLFLSHSDKTFGAQRQLFDLVEGARALGVVPIVGIPGEGPLTQAFARAGVATLRIPDVRWTGEGLQFARRYLRAQAAARDLAKEMDRLRIDVVHSNTSQFALGALAARRAGLPHVWHFHELQARWLEPRNALLRRLVARTVASTTRRIAVPSQDLANRLVAYAPEPRVQVVPNGVLRLREHRPLPPLARSPDGGLRLLTVGRPKGWETAIDTLARLVEEGRDARLTFVGGEPARTTRSRAHAAARGVVERVRFVEPVDDVAPFYASSDALLIPSCYESFGRAAVEAMAVGLPVVAHRTGGLTEIVDDGRTGWLVEVDDVPRMAAAVGRVADDVATTERIRRAAYADVWRRYTIEPFADAFAALYRSCLA